MLNVSGKIFLRKANTDSNYKQNAIYNNKIIFFFFFRFCWIHYHNIKIKNNNKIFICKS